MSYHLTYDIELCSPLILLEGIVFELFREMHIEHCGGQFPTVCILLRIPFGTVEWPVSLCVEINAVPWEKEPGSGLVIEVEESFTAAL